MMAGSMSTSNSDLSKKTCAMCKHADCDLDMVGGCGCSFHARCLPFQVLVPYHQRMSTLTIINNGASGNSQVVGYGNDSNTSATSSHDHSITCPACKTVNRGMFLYPLTFDDLDLAAKYNQQLLHGKDSSNSKTTSSNKNCELNNNLPSKISNVEMEGRVVNLKSETSMMMHHNDHSQQTGTAAGQVRKRGSGYLNTDMEMMPVPIISSSAERIIDSHRKNSPILATSSSESGLSSNNDPKPVDSSAQEGNSNVEHIHSGAVPYLVFSKSNLSTVTDFSANHEGKDSTAAASKSSNNTNTIPDNDKLHFRTGRWTGAETSYVDLLIKMFDSQQLSCMPGGIKLNELLRDLVLCKSSRLTKKYKNAKLSTRSFRSFGSGNNIGSIDLSTSSAPPSSQPNYAQVLLSQSQQQFLDSIRSKVTRLILQFNLRKMWRIHLSNLCLQIGYNGLYSADWIKSLDELEKRVNTAETNVRRVRRRRMEVALRHDIIGNHNVIVAGAAEVIVGNADSTPSHGKLDMPKKRKQSINTHDLHAKTKMSNSNSILNIATNITMPTSPSVLQPVQIQRRERSNSAVHFGRIGGGKSLVHNPNTIQKKREEVANGRLVAKVSDVSIYTSLSQSVQEHSIPNLSIYNSDFLNSIPNTLSTSQSSTIDNAYPKILPNNLVPKQEVVHQTNMLVEVSPPGPGPENNDDDDDFSIGIFDLDDFVSSTPHPYLHDNSDDDASTSSHGSPFMSRIITYIQQEDLPFHYIDVWVPCLTSTEQAVSLTTPFATDQKSSSNNPVRLIHAGDSKRSDLTPLAIMQFNEFGIYSKNYSFDCGAGMPGRVYSTSSWTWQENVQDTTPQQFERKGGARMCNIRTAVGIPIRSSKIGHIVVGLYSLWDVKEDATIANKLMTEFQQHDPQPKWSLFIDVLPKVATIGQGPTSGGSKTYSQENCSEDVQFNGKKMRLNDTSFCAQSIASQTSDLTSTASQIKRPEGYLTESEAAAIANILAEHMPMQENTSASLSSFISLRLMLLRYPNGCADDEKKLFLIKMSYDGYRKVHKSQATIANLLVRDWDHLNASTATDTCRENNGGVMSPWGHPMTFTDHKPSSSLIETPLQTSIATSNDGMEMQQQNFIPTSTGSHFSVATNSNHPTMTKVPGRRDRLSSTATMISSSISEVTNVTNNLVSSSSLNTDNYIQSATQSFDATRMYY